MRSLLVLLAFAFSRNSILSIWGRQCGVINLAIVCMGNCNNGSITPMLKSLLHHRKNPIHINFIVDTNTEEWLIKWIEFWNLPDLKCTFYNAEAIAQSKLRWIPNQHYSGIYGFVKLLLPDILPESLHHVIALDTDLTFICDVAELWVLFRNMTESQFLGLTENLSDWYQKRDHWPALGKGFNGGVQLLALHKMREMTDWNNRWRKTIKKNLKKMKQVQLVDQDVINAIIKEDPRIVYRINCVFNVQMATEAQPQNCYRNNIKNVKIIHWNTPSKTTYNKKIKDAKYFWDIYLFYVHLDLLVLKRKSHRQEYTNICLPNSTTEIEEEKTYNDRSFASVFRAMKNYFTSSMKSVKV